MRQQVLPRVPPLLLLLLLLLPELQAEHLRARRCCIRTMRRTDCSAGCDDHTADNRPEVRLLRRHPDAELLPAQVRILTVAVPQRVLPQLEDAAQQPALLPVRDAAQGLQPVQAQLPLRQRVPEQAQQQPPRRVPQQRARLAEVWRH